MKIHRYPLAPTIEIPAGAVFLDAKLGMSGPSLWFLVDAEAPPETRRFAIVATGQELPEAILDAHHLCTMKAIIATKTEAVPTALHVFDTTQCNGEIPSIDPTKPQDSKDPADWWKS